MGEEDTDEDDDDGEFMPKSGSMLQQHLAAYGKEKNICHEHPNIPFKFLSNQKCRFRCCKQMCNQDLFSALFLFSL